MAGSASAGAGDAAGTAAGTTVWPGPAVGRGLEPGIAPPLDATHCANCAGGKLVERLSMEGDKLVVERFDPVSLYPKSPNNKGEGVREK